MSENPAMTGVSRIDRVNNNGRENTPEGVGNTRSTNNQSMGRPNNRPRFNHPQSSTPRDFAGATPKIGGILALRSENITNNVTYDKFCEKLKAYIMNKFKGGENIVEVTKNPSVNIISAFDVNSTPKNLTKEGKESDIDVELKKEEIKELKDLKLIKSNLRQSTTWYTEIVQTVFK